MGRSELDSGTAANVDDDPYARAIAYAEVEGRRAGENAAGWYTQDTIGGRVTGDPRPAARRILAGLEDGDSEILDTLPHADLSGEWADTLTGPQLYRDACDAAGLVESDGAYVSFDSICDAYELAFSTAAEDAIATACRAVLS